MCQYRDLFLISLLRRLWCKKIRQQKALMFGLLLLLLGTLHTIHARLLACGGGDMSDYAHPILMSTPSFESHRRACNELMTLKNEFWNLFRMSVLILKEVKIIFLITPLILAFFTYLSWFSKEFFLPNQNTYLSSNFHEKKIGIHRYRIWAWCHEFKIGFVQPK